MNKYLILFIVITFSFKIVVLDRYGLAGDEKYTAIVSQFLVQEGTNQQESLRDTTSGSFSSLEFWSPKTFKDFQESMARRENGSGAAYFLTLHYWTQLFGLKDFSLRLFSLLFTLLLLPVIYKLAQVFFPLKKELAVLSVFLAGISPFLFNYGLIARNYAFTYFWFALGTLALIKILRSKERLMAWHLLYAISLILCIFGHHSAYIIFLLHTVIFLIEMQWKKVWGLLLAGIPSISLFLLWLSSEGGKYTFEFIENSKIQYLELAKQGLIKTSTIPNVISDFLGSLSNLFIGLSAQFQFVSIPKIQLLIIGTGLVLFFLDSLPLKEYMKWGITLIILAFPSFWYKSIAYHETTAIIGIWMLMEIISIVSIGLKKNSGLIYLLILSFFPLLILIQYAFSDGTLTRLNVRYAGFGFPFLIILTAYGLNYLFEQKKSMKLVLFGSTILFLSIVENRRVFKDNSPKYFHSVAANRDKNPYESIANIVLMNYANGDTLIHALEAIPPDIAGNVKMPKYSVQDAQYINLYFSKKGKNIIQKFSHDSFRKDKIFLKKANGEEILIFDFEGQKYRY